jgi:meso-butanediol dehydrogenase/(S,S)-butanediol dehydrogenase/diacetyl reductase
VTSEFADGPVRRPRFAERIAVVCGGARGIGRAIALRLGEEGAHVVVADQAADAAEETASRIRDAGGSAEAHPLDATDASSVGRLFYTVGESFGRVDVLVNCPAHASDTHFERITESEFDFDIAATLKAPFLCTQAAIPHLLRSQHGGNVVSIGSVNGLKAFGNEVYGAAKAGLSNITQNLAVRYGPLGLRFNVVAPGTVRTRSWESRLATEPDMLAGIAEMYPMRRVGTPDEIAAACVFLASDEAAWITGVTLPVDGGITAGHPRFIEETFGSDFFSSMVERRPIA